jgi:hypothetical protein
MGCESLHGVIIDQAHMIVGHFGPQRTADYMYPAVVLVAANSLRGAEVLQLVSGMFKSEGGCKTPTGAIALLADTHSTVAIDQHGLYRSIS